MNICGSVHSAPVLACQPALLSKVLAAISVERLSSLAILHIHKHKDVGIDNVVFEFIRLNISEGETF